jgi:exodeoxyribonuclease V alpha subunit
VAVERLTGCVSRVAWTSPDGASWLAILEGGEACFGPPPPGHCFPKGLPHLFIGQWTEHPRHGRRFAYASCSPCPSPSREGAVAYLTAAAPHVGPRRAAALWDAYGPGAVQALRERPREVAARGLMPEAHALEASAALALEAALEPVRVDLYGLLCGRGFVMEQVLRHSLRLWGAAAAAMIRRDPYLLLTKQVPSCGWKRVDRLYLDLGGRPGRPKRQAMAVWHLLRTDSSGDTWLPAARACEALKLLIGAGADPVRALRLARRAGLIRKRGDGQGGVWVAEAGRADAEARLAEGLGRVLAWERPNGALSRRRSAAASARD